MTRDQFLQYSQLCAGNVLNKEGQVRFTYQQLRTSLDAVKSACYSKIDPQVQDLYKHIMDAVKMEVSDNQEVVLILLLLNIHMAYGLTSGYTLNDDPLTNN